MPELNQEEAIQKRNELVEFGYTLVPGVMPEEFLLELRQWEQEVFEKVPVDPKFRYQGSDIHVSTMRRWKKLENPPNTGKHFAHPLVDKLVDFPRQKEICAAIGLEGLVPSDVVILLSKPPHGPPLYWHQDCMNWHSPRSATPWPTKVFLSYYLVDTRSENGCFRVIPGTHCKRIALHEQLPAAHGPEIQAIEDLDHPIFMDHPDAVDVPCKAGDLLIADARVLHGAHPNSTDQRRTLLLMWHDVLSFPEPPSWWTGKVPAVVQNADLSISYEPTRIPGEHLK